MKLPSKAFLSATKTVRAACKTNKDYDVMGCVRLEAADGLLTISAVNLDLQVAVSLPCDGDLASALVNSEDLLRWLNKAASDGDATVSISEQAISLSIGRASVRLPVLPPAQWPVLSEDDHEAACVVAGPALCEALSAASVAVFADPSRPWLCGVSLESGSVLDPSATDRISLCGTNGVMLVAADIAATGLSGHTRVILSPAGVEAIQKLFSAEGAVSVSWGERLVFVSAGTKRLAAKLVAGKFPEHWRKLGDPGRSPHLSYDTAALCASLATVATLAPTKGDSRALAVDLTINEATTQFVTADAYGVSTATDECAHSLMEAPPRKFVRVAADQIISICGALGAETIQISVSAQQGVPLILTGAARTDRLAFSVPLRDAHEAEQAAA